MYVVEILVYTKCYTVIIHSLVNENNLSYVVNNIHRISSITTSQILMATKKDISYGIIPVRKRGKKFETLLINQISNVRGDSYWIFPKGHPVNGEGAVAAALRELKEETGLSPYKVDSERPIDLNYTFWIDGTKIQKTVTFFLGFIDDSSTLQLQPAEVKEAAWFSKADAAKRITHDNARLVLNRAFSYLQQCS